MADDVHPFRRSVMRRTFLEVLGITMLGTSLAPLAATEVRIARDRVTVTLLANLNGPDEQREARLHRDPRDDKAEIYGTPVGAPIELVISGGSNSPSLVRAPDVPDRHLLPVDSFAQFRRPLAERGLGVLWGLAQAATGLCFLLVGRTRRRRREGARAGEPKPGGA